jgi:hypothetical protein
MLTPAPEASLQRRRMLWTQPLRARTLSLVLAFVSNGLLWVVADVLWQQYPAAWPAALLLLLFGLTNLTLQLIGWRRLATMQRLTGSSPSVNRKLLQAVAEERTWALRADEPAYLVIDYPGRWYASPRQITVLWQGRDLWLHVVGRNRLGSVSLLSWITAPTLRRQVIEAFARHQARLEWEERDYDADDQPPR